MGWSRDRFSKLPANTRAKKLADLLTAALTQDSAQQRLRFEELAVLMDWDTLAGSAASGSGAESWRSVIAQVSSAVQIGPAELHVLAEAHAAWRRVAGQGSESAFHEALGRHRRIAEPEPRSRDQARRGTVKSLPTAEVLLHNLRSAHNVGSIIRSCECFGFAGVWLTGYTPGIEQAGVRAASMGTEAQVGWERRRDWQSAIAEFRAAGGSVLALETTADAADIRATRWPARVLLVLGNEELGVEPALLAECDGALRIPLFGQKQSLNVANAFAVAAYELRRAAARGPAGTPDPGSSEGGADPGSAERGAGREDG